MCRQVSCARLLHLEPCLAACPYVDGETESQRGQVVWRPHVLEAREPGTQSRSDHRIVLPEAVCTLSFPVQFASICCIPVYTVGVNKWRACGRSLNVFCPCVEAEVILAVCVFCWAVYRATPLYGSVCTNLLGSLPLPAFQRQAPRVREVKCPGRVEAGTQFCLPSKPHKAVDVSGHGTCPVPTGLGRVPGFLQPE